MTAGLPPAEKLPLAARKSVRDDWEGKKGDLEAKLSKLLKTDWKFDINPLVIWPYGTPGEYAHNSLGNCIHEYADSAVSNIKDYVQRSGEEGVAELNSVVPTHTISMNASDKVSYCGGDVVDGVLRIVFHPKSLGSNISNAFLDFHKIVDAAPQPQGASKIPFAARHSIKEGYEAKLGDLQAAAAKYMGGAELKWDPNFEEVAVALAASSKARDDWPTNLGNFTYDYFDGLIYRFKGDGFDKDDMLREGFEEAIPSLTVKFKVVDKITKTYNDMVIEDGILYLRTTPEYWGTNIDYICEDLMKML